MSAYRTVRVQVKDRDKVVRDFTLDYDGHWSSLTSELLNQFKLPSRSPLHPKALNLEDLQPDLVIQRRNIDNQYVPKTGIVIGQPFRTRNKNWIVSVVTKNNMGRLVREDWFLTDMGVVPHENFNGLMWWNAFNYTLAV